MNYCTLTTIVASLFFAASLSAKMVETPPSLPVQGNNEFALKLYQQLQGNTGNLFYSPYSLSSALAMTAQGARGQTAEQMYETLGLNGEDKAAIHAAFGQLLQQLNGDSKDRGYQLAVANALWGQKHYNWRPEFLAESKKNYNAGLNEVDFVNATEAARKTINTWVEKQTNEKIKDLIKPGVLGRMTRLVLTNAIYFKGNWASQFKKDQTKDEMFFLTADDKIKSPLMHQTGEFRYLRNEQLKVLEMPYVKNELSMVFILPNKIDGLADVEKSLTSHAVEGLLRDLRKTENIPVTIPKFKMTCEFSLAKELQKMGMDLAFGGKADFTGMSTQEGLCISDVIHKAFVEVNEEGTEAAAATAIAIRATAMPIMPAEPPSFRADHPFLFLIRDVKSGTILFIGRIADPTK